MKGNLSILDQILNVEFYLWLFSHPGRGLTGAIKHTGDGSFTLIHILNDMIAICHLVLFAIITIDSFSNIPNFF